MKHRLFKIERRTVAGWEQVDVIPVEEPGRPGGGVKWKGWVIWPGEEDARGALNALNKGAAQRFLDYLSGLFNR
ncbi:MAG: hypothetical protein ABIT92_00115 [Gammaproteobacteria bacterium]